MSASTPQKSLYSTIRMEKITKKIPFYLGVQYEYTPLCVYSFPLYILGELIQCSIVLLIAHVTIRVELNIKKENVCENQAQNV